jgi:release factor glutamine methyltransferase
MLDWVKFIQMVKKLKSQDLQWLAEAKYQNNLDQISPTDKVRLMAGEPLDYVIGQRDFLGLSIDLSFQPLIPRAETEWWTDLVITDIKARTLSLGRPLVILDLFAGSGAVGLAVLKHCPSARVIFADLAEASLKQIKKNLDLLSLGERAEIIKSDLFSGLAGRDFDFILANPPYIPTLGRGSRVDRSVKNYEPAEALWAGTNGLKFSQPFLKQAKNYLRPEGQIWLEFGFGQKTALRQLLTQNGFKQFSFKRDLFGRWRLLVLKI